MEPFDSDRLSFGGRPRIIVDFPVVFVFADQLLPFVLDLVVDLRLEMEEGKLHPLAKISWSAELLVRFVAMEDLSPMIDLPLPDLLLRWWWGWLWLFRQGRLSLDIILWSPHY